MGVAAETLEEAAHLLVHHGVMHDAIDEIGFLRGGRQFAVEQQVAGLEEVAVFGEVGDRIAAIEQHACVAVDIGDLGLAACRRGETGVVSEDAGLGIKLADVDDFGADGAVVDRERIVLVAYFERAGLNVGAGAGFRVHDPNPRYLTAGMSCRARPKRPMRLERHFDPAVFG
jgi:hypothetical protein